MSDVPEQTCTARATCDTMLLSDMHFFSAFDVAFDGYPDTLCEQTADTILDASHSQEPEARVACEERTRTGMVTILDGITKKVCVNYEQIIPEVASTEDETPTSPSYFVQGWSRLDGVDIRKTRFEMGMDNQDARKNREFNSLGGTAVAEFVTDAFLYTFEACRSRCVSDPSYAKMMLPFEQKLVTENDGTSSSILRMSKMLRFALSQWNNGCKGRWIHRTTTTMMWREVWRRTTRRIPHIRRLSDHACFEFLLLLSACANTDNARCVSKWILSNTTDTRDCEGPVFMVIPVPCCLSLMQVADANGSSVQ